MTNDPYVSKDNIVMSLNQLEMCTKTVSVIYGGCEAKIRFTLK